MPDSEARLFGILALARTRIPLKVNFMGKGNYTQSQSFRSRKTLEKTSFILLQKKEAFLSLVTSAIILRERHSA